MPKTISLSAETTRTAAFVYLITSMIVFPAILASVQDFPSLPRLTPERYFEPADPGHFPFEVMVLGGCFIAIFVVPLARAFGQQSALHFMRVVCPTAIVVYLAGILLVEQFYPASLVLRTLRTVCQDGRHICHAFGIHAYLMFLGLGAGIGIARVLGMLRAVPGSDTRMSRDQGM